MRAQTAVLAAPNQNSSRPLRGEVPAKKVFGALLSGNAFQKDIIEIYSPGERFDSYSLVFSVGPNVVAIVLLS